MRTIAKIAVSTVGLLVTGLLTAVPALAQQYPPGAEEVERGPGAVEAAEGIAVTGANVALWMVIVAGLAVVGLAALVAGRRRARARA